MDMVALFCDLDDFRHQFEPGWQQRLISVGERQRIRKSRLCLSEGMTIVITFQQSGYRTFKDYFLRYVTPHFRWAFPHLVSYAGFVERMQEALVPLCAYLQRRKGKSQGVAFIDSTLLAVCHPKRSTRHKVFAGLARCGRSSMGWCYGFKLHLLINDTGELLACQLTAANVDDRVPVPRLLKAVRGKVFGDRDYISREGRRRSQSHSPYYRDELIEVGLHHSHPCRHPLRLVSVLWHGQWYRYLTNVLDPPQLSARQVCELYRRRWRIEDAFLVTKRVLDLAYLWKASANGIQLQLYATFLFYLVLLTVCQQVAQSLNEPLERISVEMVFRAFYHYSRALTRGETVELIPYLVQHATLLGLVKRQRQRHRKIQQTEQLVWGRP